MILLEVPDDVLEADVGADDAGEESDDEDETVLQWAENELWPGVRVPVDRCVDLSIHYILKREREWRENMLIFVTRMLLMMAAKEGDAGDDHEDLPKQAPWERGWTSWPPQAGRQASPAKALLPPNPLNISSFDFYLLMTLLLKGTKISNLVPITKPPSCRWSWKTYMWKGWDQSWWETRQCWTSWSGNCGWESLEAV